MLRSRDADNADDNPIVFYSVEPWKCLTWKIQSVNSNATYPFKNHFTSKIPPRSLDKGQRHKSARDSNIFAEKWGVASEWQIVSLNDGSSKIMDTKSGQALTAEKSGGRSYILLKNWKSEDSQKWKFVPIDPASLTM